MLFGIGKATHLNVCWIRFWKQLATINKIDNLILIKSANMNFERLFLTNTKYSRSDTANPTQNVDAKKRERADLFLRYVDDRWIILQFSEHSIHCALCHNVLLEYFLKKKNAFYTQTLTHAHIFSADRRFHVWLEFCFIHINITCSWVFSHTYLYVECRWAVCTICQVVTI